MNGDTEDLTERAPSLDRDGRAAYRVESNGRDVCTTVVRAVAEVSGGDLLTGERVLYDVVDPDALEQLFGDRPGTTGRVVFELQGCTVEVHADGEHVVYEPLGCNESGRSAVKSA